MSPSIEQLDRFVRSARAGSYSAAAQELYVSPQTVSKSVHDMEHKLNIVLFEPTGRRLRPTARGAQVLHRASEVLEGVDDIRRICGDGGLSGAAGTSRLRVAVASSPLRGSVMAERDFRGFRRRCPHIALDVSFLSSGSCLSELESGAVDAAGVSAWVRSSCACWCRAGMRLPHASHLPLPTWKAPCLPSRMIPAGLRRRRLSSFPGTACVRAWRRWRCRRRGIMAFSMKTEGRCS